MVSPWDKPESAENHGGTLRLYHCTCGFLDVYLQTSASIRLTGTPEEIPTSQANRGPGPSPKQEVSQLALPFQEHQQQETLAGCAWRLQLFPCQSTIEVRCSLLLGLAKQITQGLVCSGSRRELPPTAHNPGPFYHPEDTGTGVSLSHCGYLGMWECLKMEVKILYVCWASIKPLSYTPVSGVWACGVPSSYW